MRKTVVGLFDHVADARVALEELADLGFGRGDLNLVPTDPRHSDYPHDSSAGPGASSRAANSTGAGAALGAFAGGVVGLLGAFGVLKLFAITTLLAAGPIVGVVVGAVFGAGLGALIGGLVGTGVAGEKREDYSVESDSALLSVTTEDERAERAAEILSAHNAIDIDQRTANWEDAGWAHAGPGPVVARENDDPRRGWREAGEQGVEEGAGQRHRPGGPRGEAPAHPAESPRESAAGGSERDLPTLTPNESIYEDGRRSSAARLYNPEKPGRDVVNNG